MSDFFHNAVGIQLIGFAGLAIAVVVFQLNKRQQMLRLNIWANLLFSLHFFLLGAYSGAALNAVGAARNYCFVKFRYRPWSIWVLWGFIAAFTLATILTWQGPLSILPAIGMISGAFAYWQPTAKSIRLLSLIAPPAWFIYNFFSHSYAGMLIEIFIFCSILIGMYRLDVPNKKKAAALRD